MSTNANYKITFMLDSAAMITVHTPRRGLIDVRSHFSFILKTCLFSDILFAFILME